MGIGVKVFVSVERLATKIFISSPDMMADRVGGNRSGSLPSDSASHWAAGGRRRPRRVIHKYRGRRGTWSTVVIRTPMQ